MAQAKLAELLLLCAGGNGAMLCAGYAQHDFDLPFLSPSSNSKQPLQPFRAKKSLGIRRTGKLAFSSTFLVQLDTLKHKLS